jgi:hypothetical protein
MTDSISDLILNEFPRKEARGPGRKAVLKALKLTMKEDGTCLLEAVEALLRATVAFRKHREYMETSGKSEAKFTPMPATWFNQERWRDFEAWEMPPVEKQDKLTQEWAEANWGPIQEAYGIKFGDLRYFCTDWTKTLDNLPAAVRSDLKALMQ